MRSILPVSSRRLLREKRTIEAMLRVYCRGRHRSTGLCPECRELLDYAYCRLDRCPFGAEKPTCVNCPIHCYKPAMRQSIQGVMRYAGPRLIFRHPILSILHLIDGRRSPLLDEP
ncbi:MAG: nitrous oxide-stimulated promoter family protein [Isosphaeraceae bacterium]